MPAEKMVQRSIAWGGYLLSFVESSNIAKQENLLVL